MPGHARGGPAGRPVAPSESPTKMSRSECDTTKCVGHVTSGCVGIDVVFDAKNIMLTEFERISRRRNARQVVDDVLERAEIRKQVRSADPEYRRAGVLAARDHLRRLGLASELTDDVLRQVWCA